MRSRTCTRDASRSGPLEGDLELLVRVDAETRDDAGARPLHDRTSRAVHAARISSIETDATSRPSAWTLSTVVRRDRTDEPDGHPRHDAPPLPEVGGSDTHQEPGRSLAEQQPLVLPSRSSGNGKGIKGDPRPELAAETAFRNGHPQAAVGKVVAGAHAPRADGAMKLPI